MHVKYFIIRNYDDDDIFLYNFINETLSEKIYENYLVAILRVKQIFALIKLDID